MPLQATSGAASYDAFGGGVAAVPNYIEDVFSTWLFNTNYPSDVTVSNGIDLSGNGGLVWNKSRSNAYTHQLYDTVRGGSKDLRTNSTAAENTYFDGRVEFGSNGFVWKASGGWGASSFTSWTFRKSPKFFDVVTYTGNGANRTIAHNLGSVPGCYIVKRTSSAEEWFVYHRSTGNTAYLKLNDTDGSQTAFSAWNNTTPTDAVFSLSSRAEVNQSGATYVAYLFAHDSGGFGLTGTDNVISCGSYTGTGAAGNNVTLNYEPQWLLIKNVTNVTSWQMFDVMRGMPVPASGNTTRRLNPNNSDAEFGLDPVGCFPTSTGFTLNTANGDFNASGDTYIYIAIRRGPMKVPTTGASVFGLTARTGTGANATVTGGAGVTDLAIIKNRGSILLWAFASRLTGTGYLSSNVTTAETAAGTTILQANPWDVMDGIKVGTTSTITNASSNLFINYLINRAPGTFDEVCYNQTGGTIPHNLGVVPEMIMIKRRNAAQKWSVGVSVLGNGNLVLNENGAFGSPGSTARVNFTTTTASVFGIGTDADVSGSSVAYLWATNPGVTKVGTYTGNGSSQTINCGFTSGARFVIIKSASAAGNWLVADSARGIVAGNDPTLYLNGTAADITGIDWIDADSTGFVVNETGFAANTNGVQYIYLSYA